MSQLQGGQELGHDALLADKEAAEREEAREGWRALGWSLTVYTLLQGFHLLNQVVSTTLTKGAGAENFQLGADPLVWQSSAGIEPEVASTIVLGLAAFVVTINVAVFAARLGTPQDVGAEFDLARWHKRMQGIAPRACYVAFAITASQLFEYSGLALALFLISMLAWAASGLQVAERLSALRMQVQTAKRFAEHARCQLHILKDSFPPAVRKHVSDDAKEWNRITSSRGMGNILTLTVLESLVLTALWAQHPSVNQGQNIEIGSYLWLFLSLSVVAIYTTGPALMVIIFTSASKLAKQANPAHRVSDRKFNSMIRWVRAASISFAFGVQVLNVFILDLSFALVCGAIALLTCGAQYLLISVAFRTGAGPGMVVFKLAYAKRAEEKRHAEKRLEQAEVAHKAAADRHRALAEATRAEADGSDSVDASAASTPSTLLHWLLSTIGTRSRTSERAEHPAHKPDGL